MEHKLTKRALAGALAVLTVAGTMPVNVFADENEPQTSVVTEQGITFEKVEATEPTDTTKGNTEYYVGSNGKFYTFDGENYTEIEEFSWLIDELSNREQFNVGDEYRIGDTLTLKNVYLQYDNTGKSSAAVPVRMVSGDFTVAEPIYQAKRDCFKFSFIISEEEKYYLFLDADTTTDPQFAEGFKITGGSGTEDDPFTLGVIETSLEKVEATEPTDTTKGNTEYYVGSNGKFYTFDGENYTEIEEFSWLIDELSNREQFNVGDEYRIGDTLTLKNVYLQYDNTGKSSAAVPVRMVSGDFTVAEPIYQAKRDCFKFSFIISEEEKYYLFLDADTTTDPQFAEGFKITGGSGTEDDPFTLGVIETSLEKVEAKDATHEEDGNTEYYIGSNGKFYTLDGENYTEVGENSWIISAVGHTYGKPKWTWSADHTEAYASFTCEEDGAVQKVTAVVTDTVTEAKIGVSGKIVHSAIINFNGKKYSASYTERIPAVTVEKVDAVEAGCTEDGNIEYYKGSDGKFYTFADDTYTEVEEADIAVPATGHDFGEPEWTWNDDNTAVLTRTCAVCGETETVDAEVTSETVKYATYEEEGLVVYTAVAVIDGVEYTDTKEEVLPTNTLAHFDAVEPTCTSDGNFEYWWDLVTLKLYTDPECKNETDIFAVTIPRLKHNYETVEWDWSDDYETVTASFTCSICGKTENVDAKVTSETVEPSYTADGKITYTAVATIDGVEYTDTKEVTLDKLAASAVEFEAVAGKNAVQLKWDAVDGAEKYAVCGFVSGKWRILAEGYSNSYVLNDLKAGTEYNVAVIAKVGGIWRTDFSNAAVVSPLEEAVVTYPEVTAEVSGNQIKLDWTEVEGAEKYGIAVLISGKWKVQAYTEAGVTTFTTPKIAKGTYKIVVCAKVNGSWNIAQLNSRAVEAVIK